MPTQKPKLVNLDLDLIRAFVAVADAKSFTRAGVRLGRTQSTVSLQIKRLEEQLDAELFSRDPRKVVLTARGEGLLTQARRLLRVNDEIIGDMFEYALEGEVRFGAPEDFATTHLRHPWRLRALLSACELVGDVRSDASAHGQDGPRRTRSCAD